MAHFSFLRPAGVFVDCLPQRLEKSLPHFSLTRYVPVHSGKHGEVKKLLEAGLDWDWSDDDGYTLLPFLAQRQDPSLSQP